MKKNYLVLSLLFVSLLANAQVIEPTHFRGAFAEAGSTDWTDNWAEWDPQFKPYPNTTTTVQTDITSNTTWNSGDVILLKNKVYVTNNAVLTIQPGCVIRGDKATEGTLIIGRGSKIIADGTATNPIVFTSNYDTAQRAVGDWGGVIILGKGIMNQGTAVVEGGLDTAKARYGGVDSLDNSGILRYVRIEFAGYPFQPDKEINGLTFGAVGKGTTVDYVQCSFTNDDSFEWFGGNVNCKHLISYSTVDDDFDTDFGYSGHVQFGLIIRDPELSDQAASSTSEGFESDNDGQGSNNQPQTKAVFSNITMVGPYRGNTASALPANADFKRCIRIRRNSAISVLNSIFTNFNQGVSIEGAGCEDNATGDTIQFKNNTFASIKNDDTCSVLTGSTFNINQWFANNNNNYFTSSTSIGWVNPYPELWEKPDYRLNVGSPMLSVKDITNIITVNAYPNPTENSVTIEFISKSNCSANYIITDIVGNEVMNEKANFIVGKNIETIDLTNCANGMYFINLKVDTENKPIKIVKN